MLLYKYKSLDNLWFALDIIVCQRVYCAKWNELNDPLEGRYSFFFKDGGYERCTYYSKKINESKEKIRVACFSRTNENFLLWSHYASGHKGVAIEIDIPDATPELSEVSYTRLDTVFSYFEADQLNEKVIQMLTRKTEEWAYEQEIRILHNECFLNLANPIRRIYVGPLADSNRIKILKQLMPDVEFINMRIDRYQGVIVPNLS